jgi:hypothetical protein
MTFVMKDSDMKKYTHWGPGLFGVLGCLFLLLGFSGCGQEPLFYHISYEEAPVDPFIEGGPSKIVADSAGTLYISNGRLFSYTAGSWSRLGGEPGMVRDVAVVEDTSTLYIMTIRDSDTGVWKKDGGSWKELTNDTAYSFVQNIFGAGDRLFVSARKTGTGSSEEYGILYEDGDKFSLLSDKNGGLSGAVEIGGSYYLATPGNGIFKVPKASLGPNTTLDPAIDGTQGLHIMGLLELELGGNKYAAASTRGGGIIIYDPVSDKSQSFSYGRTFTEAFALWQNPTDSAKKLLLVGIRNSSSSSNGYREIPIQFDTTSRVITLGGIQAPGEVKDGRTTVSNNPKYNSSLEKHAINALFVASGVSTEDGVDYPVVFASTQQDGLWVYRDGSWKAQE